MRLLWEGSARVYFNEWNEAPLLWSIDAGDGTGEFKCRSIRAETLSPVDFVAYPERQEPRAWAFYHNVSVWYENEFIWIR